MKEPKPIVMLLGAFACLAVGAAAIIERLLGNKPSYFSGYAVDILFILAGAYILFNWYGKK